MMRSMPKVSSAARNGGSLKIPLVVSQGAANRPRQMLDVERGDLVNARQHHRQHFTHVADDEPQPRVPIQRPSKHHAKHVDRRLRMPSPRR
jgi:hypothetical protein